MYRKKFIVLFAWWFLILAGGMVGGNATVIGPFADREACEKLRGELKVVKMKIGLSDTRWEGTASK